LSVQLVSEISNLCDHNPIHQRHRRTTYDRKTALCTKVHSAVTTCPGRAAGGQLLSLRTNYYISDKKTAERTLPESTTGLVADRPPTQCCYKRHTAIAAQFTNQNNDVEPYTYSVSQKKSPLRTCGNFSKTAGNFSTKFYVPIMRSYLR